MGKNKGNYYHLKKKKIMKKIFEAKKKVFFHYINGKKYNLIKEYLDFLTNLKINDDLLDPDDYQIYSDSWFSIRNKRITSSSFKRFLSFTAKSSYIYRFCESFDKPIFGNRGNWVEKFILNFLKEKEIKIIDNNRVFIHEDCRFLSTTIDGIVVIKNKKLFCIEIKSFLNCPFETLFQTKNGKITRLKKNNEIYHQIQITIDILKMEFCWLIFEFDYNIYQFVVEKEEDYLKKKFKNIIEKYYKFVVPFSLFGYLKKISINEKPSLNYFSKRRFNNFFEILKKCKNKIINAKLNERFFDLDLEGSFLKKEKKNQELEKLLNGTKDFLKKTPFKFGKLKDEEIVKLKKFEKKKKLKNEK